jgi:mono/diheme cytochrome c family protein/glucose/arabinose dehydrogenase
MKFPASSFQLLATSSRLPVLVISSVLAVAGAQQRPWPPPVQKVPANAPALSPDDALKTFYVPPGYRVELVASEPLVQDPIVMDQDPDGRIWVLEMPGFAEDVTMQDSRASVCRAVVLEDTDHDGRMDKRTVFMDGLVLPRAIKVLDHGVLIGEPPNLWLARDTNGDLKADAKELVRDDFGRLEGNLEHNANGLYWGMDNWIYTAEHDWHLRMKNGKLEVEKTLSRGQWGLSMDDAGRIFRNFNDQPLFVDIVPAKYFVRNPNVVRTRGLYEPLIDRDSAVVWPVRPTLGVNRGYRAQFFRPDGTSIILQGAGTPVVYRGDQLPKELLGDAFITDSPTNLVHRFIVSDDGAGRLTAKNAYEKGEFLASTDERFRPVNLYSAADGTLYVIDMYRGVVQDVQFQTDYLRDYIKTHHIELPVGLGRIYRVVHDTTKGVPAPALSKAAPAELVKALSHPNGWWRDTAQRLLVERAETSVVPALKQLAGRAPDYRTRLHALWTLDGLDAIDVAAVQLALADKSADVRASAVRLSERWLGTPNHPLQAIVIKKLDDPNWMVRRQVSASLGELPNEARFAALASVLERLGSDPISVDAAVSGLSGQESQMLAHLLQKQDATAPEGDAIGALAGAVARSHDQAALAKVLDAAAEARRPEWQRVALLRGAGMGLEGGGRGGGRGGAAGTPSRGRGATVVSLSHEPSSLLTLAAGSGELADTAKAILSRVDWPGKPAPAASGPPLTAEEQKRFDEGQQIYRNLCSGCHQPDGQGREKLAPSLVASPYVTAEPSIVTRIILAGKEGKIGLMPPLRAVLSDEQIAAVLTYIRREWGHTASPVAPADVTEVRGLTSTRTRPWTDEEIGRMLAGRGGRGGQ